MQTTKISLDTRTIEAQGAKYKLLGKKQFFPLRVCVCVSEWGRMKARDNFQDVRVSDELHVIYRTNVIIKACVYSWKKIRDKRSKKTLLARVK